MADKEDTLTSATESWNRQQAFWSCWGASVWDIKYILKISDPFSCPCCHQSSIRPKVLSQTLWVA